MRRACQGPARGFCGARARLARGVRQACAKHVRVGYGTCAGPARGVHGACSRRARSVCGHAQGVRKAFTKRVQSVHGACKECARSVQEASMFTSRYWGWVEENIDGVGEEEESGGR